MIGTERTVLQLGAFPFLSLEWYLMGTTRTTFLTWTIALLTPGLAGSAVLAGPIGLIDDLAHASLAEYTLTKVLDQGAGTSNISFSSPSGVLQVASAGTTGAEQVLLLRDDYTLDVGQTLLADVSGDANGWDRGFGLALGSSQN